MILLKVALEIFINLLAVVATLVALTIMIAESRPEEKEMMISVVMNCMG